MLGLNEHAAIIVFPILFVVIVARIVFYFLERGKSRSCKLRTGQREESSQTILVKGAKESKSEEKRNVGKSETQEKLLESRDFKQQKGKIDKPEQRKKIEESQVGQMSAPVSSQELKQSIGQPEKLVKEKEKAPGKQWEEIETKWSQIKNNDSSEMVKKLLGPPTSIKHLEENRELWVYVYGMKEKRTITFNCGILEKIEIGENAFAKALIDLQARKS